MEEKERCYSFIFTIQQKYENKLTYHSRFIPEGVAVVKIDVVYS
jgi:hypothetical protein